MIRVLIYLILSITTGYLFSDTKDYFFFIAQVCFMLAAISQLYLKGYLKWK